MGFKRGVFHSFFHKQALVFHRHYVELDVKRSDVLSHYNTMLIYYTIATQHAIYNFVVNQDADQARITRWILKGSKGVHASTSMTVDGARQLAYQLHAR